MRKTIIITTLCLLLQAFHTLEAQGQTVTAYTDKSCYLAGERLHVSLRSTSPGKVAYIELSDTKGMVAQAMAYMDNGKGWAEINLPQNLHSGNYLMSAYTREMRNQRHEPFFQKIISVVSPTSITNEDDIVFLKPEEQPFVPRREYQAGQVARITLPADSAMTIETLSVVHGNLLTADYSHASPSCTLATETTKNYVPEIEGHIITGRPAASQAVSQTHIVLVGKEQDVYDGQPSNDGTWTYYTSNIKNSQPLLLNGYTEDYKPAPMQFVSPYAQVTPSTLPALQVWCTKEDLQKRSAEAAVEQKLTEWLKADTLHFARGFLSNKPDYQYDMDEYTKMNNVQEALVEFVKGVRRRTVRGTHQLFTLLEDGSGYSDWSALVLLDGVPVYDIDEILSYDARLLKYIQVYFGTYTFGSTLCRGIISCITKKGLLSNYKLDEGSHLVTYDFPQDHPTPVMPSNTAINTVYWNPCVESTTVDFPTPTLPGIYQVILQGKHHDGTPFQSISEIRVR